MIQNKYSSSILLEEIKEERVNYSLDNVNKLFTKLDNKELSNGDKIIVDGTSYIYEDNKIKDCEGKDLTILELYKAQNIDFITLNYVFFNEAISSGKRIRYEHDLVSCNEYYNVCDILERLSTHKDDDIVKQVLSSKCWIIEV